jgi:hypothetical protein
MLTAKWPSLCFEVMKAFFSIRFSFFAINELTTHCALLYQRDLQVVKVVTNILFIRNAKPANLCKCALHPPTRPTSVKARSPKNKRAACYTRPLATGTYTQCSGAHIATKRPPLCARTHAQLADCFTNLCDSRTEKKGITNSVCTYVAFVDIYTFTDLT